MKIEMYENKEKDYEICISHFQNEDPKGVVLVFPGAGYSHMGPCLYYPSNALLELGYDVINFEYDFRKKKIKDESVESYAEFYTFLMNSVKNIDLPATKVALAKSIGTRILASGDPSLFSKIIWLTPAIKNQFVVDSIINCANKSQVIIGDKDPFFDKEIIKNLKDEGVSLKIIPGADHGLDIDSDLDQSLEEMKSIVTSIEDFIQ